MASSSTDPEKGPLMSAWAVSGHDTTTNSDSNSQTPLHLFQLLVGINTPACLTQDGKEVGRITDAKFWRTATSNIGLYERAREQARVQRIKYICTAVISNTLYLLQILLASAFTAMSAYKDTRPVTLTVLGAINTVLAG